MPALTMFEVTPDHPVPISPQGGTATVTVLSGDTLYYADTPQVSAAHNQGSVTAGNVQSFTNPAWVRSASLSTVLAQVTAATVPPGSAVLGSDGTVGGPGGTPLTGSVAKVNAGALAGDATRTSTLGVPVLRDFASVKDAPFNVKGGGRAFAAGGNATALSTTFTDTTNSPFTVADTGMTIIIPGAGTGGVNFSTTVTYIGPTQLGLTAAPAISVTGGGYQLGWDDTVAVQAAETYATGKVLYYPPDVYIWSSVTPAEGATRWGYGATVYQIPNQPNALWYSNDVSSTKVGFRLFGFKCVGEGQYPGLTQYQQDGAWLVYWTDVCVRDCAFSLFPCAGIEFRGCGRVWALDNSLHDCCQAGGRNAILYTPVNPVTVSEFFCIGNRIGGTIPTAAISLVVSTATGTPPMVGPVKAVIEANTIDITSTASGFGGITLEVNTSTSTGYFARQVRVANNHINTAWTGADTWGITCQNNNPADANPTALQDVTIESNTINSASGGIRCYASNALITRNIVHAACPSGGTNALTINTAAAGSSLAHVKVDGNEFHGTSAAATSILQVTNLTYSTIRNNLIYNDAAATNGGHGIWLTTGCQWLDVDDNTIENAWFSGINIQAMHDMRVRHNTIYNANAANTTSTSNGNGISLSTGSAPAGTLNQVDFNTIYDDRVTHQMLYAVLQNSSGTANPTLRYNIMRGVKAGNPLTNAPANFSDIRGNTTDQPNGFPFAPNNPVAPASGAALTSTDPFDSLYYWSTAGGSLTSATLTRSGGTAKPTGTANPVRLANGDAWTPTYTGTLTLSKFPQP